MMDNSKELMDEAAVMECLDELLQMKEHHALQDLVDQAAFELDDLKSAIVAVRDFADAVEGKLKKLEEGLEAYYSGLYNRLDDAEILSVWKEKKK